MKRADRRQLVSIDEAIPVTRQPIMRCAWSRYSLRGWTGGVTPMGWVQAAHSEARIDCHTRIGAQCVGAAQYRANVAKRCRDESVLVADKSKDVFEWPSQFIEHHSGETP